ncbi:phenylalanine--tRNA ligase subunit beta [Candidatus Woesearchaeota archaeon]|nr:phenylalanine--tRNA ligase subunit beta [Nanoarchaeota archaeon]MCB9370986.1 phenylalanine--tRNA ligase subunit beta [Candidatus Woesearchaeota archaeon]USN44087.1 MAG: phenylalanine--tRNA ligase subunit beta [Candidatus Woesearchaeota archaeon]
MVYVYARHSHINKHLPKKLSVEEIKDTLINLGMDLKGESADKDPELKIEITAEKMDMISPVGIARAIAYYRGFVHKLREYKLLKAKEKVIVDKSVEAVRPKTVAAIIRDAPMNQEFLDEIIALQEKIHDSFGRGRKKAAIGIYPLDEISFPIIFKAEKPDDIVFRPLESEKEMSGYDILVEHDTGKKYAHLLAGKDIFPVFRDAKGKVLSMPPIINSHDTGRVDMQHKDLFIEVSGHNITHLDNILRVLVSTLIELGAQAEKVKVEYPKTTYELSLENSTETLSLNYVNKLIGTNIQPDEVEAYLNKVQFSLKESKGDKLTVEIPCYRSDIWHDCDIADDIARAYGYNNIVPTFPQIGSVASLLPSTSFRDSFSEMLVNLGFLETYTYMLTSTKEQFSSMLREEKEEEYIRLLDSEDQGLNMLRTMILPECLRALHINRKNKYPQKIFENGFVILPDKSADTGASNEGRVCVCIAGPDANFTQIKGILDTLLKLQEVEARTLASSSSYFIEGRQASIIFKDSLIGEIGEVHPQVLDNFGMLVPVAALELNLDTLYKLLERK